MLLLPPAPGGFYFHGGSHSHPTETTGPARVEIRPAPGFRDRGAPCAPGPTPCANPSSTRSPSPAIWSRSMYLGRASGTRRHLQTVHRPRRDLPLGCDSISHSRHRPNRGSVPRYSATPHALSSFARCKSTAVPSSPPSSELACQQRRLHLFVLPPRSPKLNGAVERANRTHTEEFYQVTACSLQMKTLNRELRHWEKIYNTVRPHQALGYLTPQHVQRQLAPPPKE